jgi:hypothetical protein
MPAERNRMENCPSSLPVGSKCGSKERLRNRSQMPHGPFPAGNLERRPVQHRLLTHESEQLDLAR